VIGGWDRQPREPARRFDLFRRYRELGPGRSLAKLAQATGRNLRTLERYSVEGAWVDRALAWDDHRDREAREAELAEIREFRRRQVQLGRMLQGKGIERLRELRPGELHATEARRYVIDGAELERAGLGDEAPLVEVVQAMQVNQATVEERWAGLDDGEREHRAFLLHSLLEGATADEVETMDKEHQAKRAAAEERAAHGRERDRRRLAAARAAGNGQPKEEPRVVFDEDGRPMRQAVSFGGRGAAAERPR
jgi:hypothetical protein